MSATCNQADIDKFLIAKAHEFRLDPYAFVLFAWDDIKLHDWQADVLRTLRDHLKQGELTTHEAIQIAIASGHGIGKSALVALVMLWAIATCTDTKGIVTANTENQLKTKTWSELSKWFETWRYKKWFRLNATSLTSIHNDKTWRIDQISWSERNTEAFAGMHNAGKRILIVFDEASAIPDAIYSVTEGALTDEDTQIIWLAFGNPTRAVGRFRDCFGRLKDRWIGKNIDSREVPGTNKKKIEEWKADYGEDSDFFRVRVRGLFPETGESNLFGMDEIEKSMAMEYPVGSQDHAAVILGVDVARQGADSSAIATRRGKVIDTIRMMRIPDTMLVASNVCQKIDADKADACFVDESGGYGAGVVDAMRQLNKSPIGIQFGGKPNDPRYFNKRSEMYFELSKWIKAGGKLPQDEELKEELLAIEYYFANDKFRIVDKDDTKELIGRSPDRADAVILTFAHNVAPKGLYKNAGRNKYDVQRGHDPFKH
jgi:hypothetical protein